MTGVGGRLGGRLGDAGRAARGLVAPLGGVASTVRRATAPARDVVRPAGWMTLSVAVVATLLGGVLGWTELAVLGCTAALVLLISTAFLLGRAGVDVGLTVEPRRVAPGTAVAGQVDVTNSSRAPVLPMTLDLAVGSHHALFALPLLLPGAEHSEVFVVDTERRGVITVGPVVTGRGDPLGLLRRDVSHAPRTEVLVRPVMVPLAPMGAGFARDLEGVSSQDLSSSDLAFHALREYTPGDDLRHVHWRSSAKAKTLLVRQYLDTRRTHAGILVDPRSSSYADDEAFELAMSVAGSLAVRAVTDEFAVSYFCGDQTAAGAPGHAVLDAVCRSEPSADVDLPRLAQAASTVALDTSLLFVLSGERAEERELRRVASCFAPEVRKVVVRACSEGRGVGQDGDGTLVLSLDGLAQLPGLLQWGVA